MRNKSIEDIDSIIKDFIKKSEVPGLAIGIIEKDKVIYSKGFGVKSLETLEEITTDTIFHMASISKPFVATSIMQLVEKEKIELDDPIVRHLKYFKVKDHYYETITIREMLNHISGMPDVIDYEWDKPEYDDKSLERYIKSLSTYELLKNQRGKFMYSNIAFEVLGDLISKVSGESFEDYINNNILTPLNMKKSTFLNKEVNKALLATPHCMDITDKYKVSSIFPYNRKHAPSSTLYSNIFEMFNWIKVNLNKGKFNEIEILNEESYLELLKIAVPNGREGYSTHVGLSWFLGNHKGYKVVSHGGSDIGFKSNLVMIPEKNIGFVWMTNSDFIEMNILTETLLDILL